MQPVITIFCAFTRPWAIEQWLEDLSKVEHDPSRTHLAIIIDGDYKSIWFKIKQFTERRKYRSVQYRLNHDWVVNESRISTRRFRIADIKEQSKELIANTDCSIVIGLEDDTVFGHIGSFKQLYEPIVNSDQVGFVEGVQMGRWGVRMVGVWQFDHLVNPLHVETCMPPADRAGTQKITAGGFYGYATRKELYLNHEHYASSAQPWGPDVNFGVWINQQGFECLVDWSVEFGHNDNGRIGWPYAETLQQVLYNKDTATGKWNRTDK